MKTLDELSTQVPLRAGAVATVLLVDDEGAVRRFAGRVLEREGYTVREARDGAEALDLVRQGGSFEVVVSDIVMPRLNGVELMQALASSHPDLPFILMSGYATAALSETRHRRSVFDPGQAVPSRATRGGGTAVHPAATGLKRLSRPS